MVVTVEAFHIIRIFQPLLSRKIFSAALASGRWKIQYRNSGVWLDLSTQLKGEIV